MEIFAKWPLFSNPLTFCASEHLNCNVYIKVQCVGHILARGECGTIPSYDCKAWQLIELMNINIKNQRGFARTSGSTLNPPLLVAHRFTVTSGQP